MPERTERIKLIWMLKRRLAYLKKHGIAETKNEADTNDQTYLQEGDTAKIVVFYCLPEELPVKLLWVEMRKETRR